MRALTLTLWLLGPASAAWGGEIEHVEARHQRGVFTVDLEMVLNASAERVEAIVNDYDGLLRLSSAIVESARLPPTDAEPHRRRVVYRSCFVFYCVTCAMIEAVRFPAPMQMHTQVEPEGSDFRAGHSEWELVPVGEDRTRIRMHSELEPGFWVPPVVGPWLIRRKMLAAAQETGGRLEQLAAHD
ncbi:MAG: SRPBCC family protein [Gammaproteobacteria bacterium]|nr:SRPBCC family protein [Gammaproteobacteria bacterium]